MNYLFFFVHPSKFHVFRNTINYLKVNGHKVDIVITSKDILETLVKSENWDFTNIFPEGRKIKIIPKDLGTGINFFRTIWRLYKYVAGKRYDLFITDDLLVYLGGIKKIPTIVFLDDDITIVKKFGLILSRADYILAPFITDLGKYSQKKIGFPGYKELAYLHPNQFKPDISVIKSFNPELAPYFLIRLVSLSSYHDAGIKGISDDDVRKLINLLETKGKVYISAERQLPAEFEKYRLKVNPVHIAHVLYYAQMFIGDSQTMTSEAAVLGTPSFRCNDFAGKISVMEEKEIRYGLSFNYLPSHFKDMLDKIEFYLEQENYKESFREKRMEMINDKIDLTSFMIWLFEKYPSSINQISDLDFSFARFR